MILELCWYIFHYSLVSHLISTLIIISKPTEIPTDVPTFDVSLQIHIIVLSLLVYDVVDTQHLLLSSHQTANARAIISTISSTFTKTFV